MSKKSGNLDYASLKSITQAISNAVNSSKLKYHECFALKLNNPKAASIPKNPLESTKNIC